MTDRIACINPNCRRTADRDKHPGSRWIICGKCWKALPDRMRKRWKQLNARWRKVERTMRKRNTGPVVWNRVVERLEGAWDRLNHDITHYFTASEQPVGLEDFMKENGLV
ncbi:hypothetical protein ACA106_20985 [Agrobacterium pusense]|uniref:hypothetical protein n=1 Tax=Agrobacterium pusense TaxID=648995 RepID=UPI0035A5C63B